MNINYFAIGILGAGLATLVGAVLYKLDIKESPTTTIQRITCVYNGQFTFTADNIYFQRFTGESVEFRDIEGNVVSYKMYDGEYCGWQPSTPANAAEMSANPEQGVPSD